MNNCGFSIQRVTAGGGVQLPVSGFAKFGKICGNLLQILKFKKVLNPDDVHGNDGPPTG
jgi:hypothetical protein